MKQYKLPLTVNNGRRKRAAPKSISLESQENYMAVKQAIERFITKNIDVYENVNWLYSFLNQLEQQYYVNKSQNLTIDDVLEKLKLVNF